jgi:hypothetical protein
VPVGSGRHSSSPWPLLFHAGLWAFAVPGSETMVACTLAVLVQTGTRAHGRRRDMLEAACWVSCKADVGDAGGAEYGYEVICYCYYAAPSKSSCRSGDVRDRLRDCEWMQDEARALCCLGPVSTVV